MQHDRGLGRRAGAAFSVPGATDLHPEAPAGRSVPASLRSALPVESLTLSAAVLIGEMGITTKLLIADI